MSEDKAKKTEKEPTLNKKPAEFAEAYMDCFLDMEAAADASKISIKEARELLKQDKVQAYLKFHLNRLRLSPEEYIRHLELTAFGDIKDLFEEVDVTDSENNVIGKREQLKKILDIPAYLRRRIKKIKSTRYTFGVDCTVDLVSREKAMEILAKILLSQDREDEDTSKYGVLLVPGIMDAEAWGKLAQVQQQAAQTPGKQQ